MKVTPIVGGMAALMGISAACDQSSPGGAEVQQAPEREMAEPQEQELPSMRDLDESPPEHIMVRAGEVEWEAGPASFEEGAQMAMLEGDFADDAVFTARFRLPDGFVINPHLHPNVERVTVLRGTFRLGHGEEMDPDAAQPLPAGSYTSMPKGMVHYAIADGETVIQLTSVGPWEIEYVDPANDPRLREPVGQR